MEDRVELDPLIQVQHISKVFQSAHSKTVRALEDVSFDVMPGSFVSCIGPSGSGKSTLLQIIAGLLPASGGIVRCRGDIVIRPPFEAVYLFQQYTKSLFPWKTVEQNVLFGLEHRSRDPRREMVERARSYLRQVGLAGWEESYPWQLSGGMQQRVAIARALACQPTVLLMDEPFSSLDALSRSELQDLVLQIWQDFKLTLIFVTHDIAEAVYLSQRVLVLTPQPAMIHDDVTIDLPYPRNQVATPESPLFLSYRRQFMEVLFQRDAVASAPGATVDAKAERGSASIRW